MDYCKAIGQTEVTLVSKERFHTYELKKIIDVEENVDKLTKERMQKYINTMRVIHLFITLKKLFYDKDMNEINIKNENKAKYKIRELLKLYVQMTISLKI